MFGIEGIILIVQGLSLGVSTLADFRKPSSIPPLIALAPLLIGAIAGVVSERWLLSLVIAGLTFLLFGLEYRSRVVPVILLVAGGLVAFLAGADMLAVAFLLAGLLFLMHTMAEADALAIMGCMLVSPSFEMLGSVMFGLFFSTLIALVLQQRAQILPALGKAFRRVVSRDLPSNSELTQVGVPTMWGVLAGFLFFCLRVVILPSGAAG